MTEESRLEHELFSRLWGKSQPFHSLVHHMIDVGCMGMALLQDSLYRTMLSGLVEQTRLDQETILRQIGCLFALHDVGKCFPVFQQKATDLDITIEMARLGVLQRDDKQPYFHEYNSGMQVQEWLRKEHGLSRPSSRLWHDILAQHHQRRSNGFRTNSMDRIDTRNQEFWESQQKAIRDLLADLFQVDFTTEWRADHIDLSGTLLSGLLILSDWLASNPEVYKPPSSELDWQEYLYESSQEAQRTISRLGLAYQDFGGTKASFSDYWPSISPEAMRGLQQTAEEWCKDGLKPGLLIIEAPMGEGKTETAVYVASRWINENNLGGMYVALPTAATSNQMYGRVSTYLEENSVTQPIELLHGMAWVVDELTPAQDIPTEGDGSLARQWFQPLRRGLLSPWAVGTIDQTMMAALRVRFGVLRLTGLASKVLIIDEVHAYDVYMTTIIERLLNWCAVMGVPVIMLSATLPNARLQRLVQAYALSPDLQMDTQVQPYPLISYVDTQGNIEKRKVSTVSIIREVPIKVAALLNKWPVVAEYAVEMITGGGCLAIVVNTVNDAQNLYREIKGRVTGDTWARLFHGRFKASDRNLIENKCLEAFDKRSISENRTEQEMRPQKAIIVATQVIEQSLDLDFDYMITALAPIDLILQRLGRHQRHQGRIRPDGAESRPFIILVPEKEMDYGASGKVYSPWILGQTQEVLKNYEYIGIPDDMRTLVETVYSSDDPQNDHPHYEEWQRMIGTRNKDRQSAQQYLLPAPQKKRFLAAVIQDNHSDDESTSDWLRAKTRLGSDQCDAILLNPQDYQDLLEDGANLTKARLKELMRSMVGTPAWWLKGITPDEGYCPIVRGSGLLEGKYLVCLQGNEWQGTDAKGGGIRMHYNTEYGLIREGR